MFRQILGLLIIVVIFSSCRTYNDIVYMQGLDSLQQEINRESDAEEYKIKNSDILFIRIISDNIKINQLYNSSMMSGETSSRFDDVSLYFHGYNVDDNGNITLPVLGEIYVKDKTVNEVKEMVYEKVEPHIREAYVVVKLASFKITMLGEVGSPGIYSFFNDKTTIFEAIANSGDLTDYGNRKNVLIVRPTENGAVSYRIDLTDKDILRSDLYYLKPNDLVYVESVKSKGIRMFASDYGTLITIFSTSAAALVVILNLF